MSGFFSNHGFRPAWPVSLLWVNILQKQQICKLKMHYNTASHELVDRLFLAKRFVCVGGAVRALTQS